MTEPRIFVLCSFYDESPSWLAAGIASVAPFATHVVYLDGAYGLYPEGRRSSGHEQHAAIIDTAVSAGLGCSLIVPHDVWWGNEVEKRSALFTHAHALSDHFVDWYLVIDADMVVTQYPVDLARRLARTELNVAEAYLWERQDPHATENHEKLGKIMDVAFENGHLHRTMYRAIPSLTVKGAHYRYVIERPDGSTSHLWGEQGPSWPPLEDTVKVPELRIEHRVQRRTLWRGKRQAEYYQARDLAGIEKQTPEMAWA